MSAANKSHNFGLDIIRAAAILMVLFSHFSSNLPWNLSTFFWNGFIGVELFFALSGFLVTTLILKNSFREKANLRNLTRFFSRRWLRTFPAYFAMLIIYAIGFKRLDFLSLEHILFLQAWAGGYNISVFGQTWSLCVEEYSYILVGSVGYFALMGTKKTRYFVGICILLVLGVTAARYSTALENPTYDFFDTHIKTATWLRLDAVLAGSLLATFKWAKPALFLRVTNLRVMSIVGIGSFVLSSYIVLRTGFLTTPAGMALCFPLMSVCFCLLIVGVYNTKPGNKMVRSSIQTIAKFSYSAYLTHILAMLIVNKYVSASEPYSRIAGYVFLTAVSSVLLYGLVEKPFLKMRDHFVPGDSKTMFTNSPRHAQSTDTAHQLQP